MPIPKHPDTVIIENEFYPNGLNEDMVWRHYQKYKDKILKEVEGRPVLLFIYYKLNSPIVKRNIDGKLIYLTKNNYDQIITGRTASLSVEMQKTVDYWCVDIDTNNGVSEDEIKDAVGDLVSFLKTDPLVKKTRVTLSATSYHVYGYLKKSMDVDTARTVLIKELRMKFSEKYAINERRPPLSKNISFDLAPMYFRGSHTVPYALGRNGIICLDVTDNWRNIDRRKAVVK